VVELQGSSGAGKSTLMDVLARRKTGGKITGEILVNGRPTDGNLSRIIGYVEQQDLHVPTQTILEAIEFSAFVRASPGGDYMSTLLWIGIGWLTGEWLCSVLNRT
jgi:ABC-type multidrug transport system ATPase subunit